MFDMVAIDAHATRAFAGNNSYTAAEWGGRANLAEMDLENSSPEAPAKRLNLDVASRLEA